MVSLCFVRWCRRSPLDMVSPYLHSHIQNIRPFCHRSRFVYSKTDKQSQPSATSSRLHSCLAVNGQSDARQIWNDRKTGPWNQHRTIYICVFFWSTFHIRQWTLRNCVSSPGGGGWVVTGCVRYGLICLRGNVTKLRFPSEYSEAKWFLQILLWCLPSDALSSSSDDALSSDSITESKRPKWRSNCLASDLYIVNPQCARQNWLGITSLSTHVARVIYGLCVDFQ